LVGGQATNEEGFLLQRLVREGLASTDLDCRTAGLPAELTGALANPALQATVPDIEFAHTVLVFGCEPLDEMPILDLRIRKGVSRHGLKLVVATARPSALDSNASRVIRYDPGDEASVLAGLADSLAEAGEDIVILWSERIGPAAAEALLGLADELGLAGRDGAGLLEIPSGSNGRGLREAGVLPFAGPGYAPIGDPGRPAAEMPDAEHTAYYLFETDPVRDQPDRAAWERALHRAGLVVAHASVLTEGLREHANVVFPADTYAEKDGTLVHPDGRLQRLRTAIAHPRDVRAGWWVIAEIAKRCGLDTGVLTAPMAFGQLVGAVPFYVGLTLEAIGGRGVRWPERDEAGAFPVVGDKGRIDHQIAQIAPRPDDAPKTGASSDGQLRLGTYRPIWASPEVEISPALQYTIATQQAELSPEDALRLGVSSGETIEVSQNGTRLTATAAVRSGVPEGTVFLATGIAAASANALTEPTVEISKP
jgi:NADH-quinone oxidoreductase subunit G